MITGEIKNKVDAIWTHIWAGGITNPLTVIEQLTYLIFIRSLDDKELETERFEAATGVKGSRIFPQTERGQSMRWSKFRNRDPREIFQTIKTVVFPAIKQMREGRIPDPDSGETDLDSGQEFHLEETAFAEYMRDATFEIPTPLVLQNVIVGLDDLYEHDIKDRDMQGDLYEYMLSKLSTAGQNGQFRTPKHIRNMMVELVDPTPKDRICDPACGTAGFLISSAEYIRRNYEQNMNSEDWSRFNSDVFTGYDTDKTMLRISAMNLMLHSIESPNITYMDSVSKDYTESEEYSVCLANPPFTGTINKENINERLITVVDTKKTELLFLALFLRILKKGGRCACIVPEGVLFGSSKAHRSIRRELVENNKLVAVISMPSGVFKPYSGVSTAVLVFVKTGAGGTDNVWFYNMESDGFSLDDKRVQLDESDIPDIMSRFRDIEAEGSRGRTEKSFLVPREEIAANDYDLSINKYREVVYERKEYRPTREILDEMIELNGKLSAELEELRKML